MGFRKRFSPQYILGALLLCVVMAASARAAVTPAEIRAELVRFIAERAQTRAALSIALLREGEPPALFAFGNRSPENTVPVDTKTLFQIASMSKAFTATLGLVLDAEGALDLDRPLQGWVPAEPGFTLKDPNASRLATLEDLLSHRTGVLPHNELWSSGGRTRAQIFSLLPRLAFDTRAGHGFRQSEAYRYSNIMMMAAGHAMELKMGRSWESMIAEKIFAPIGMTSSVTTTREFLAASNASWGRSPGEAGFRPIDMANIGPAASISSNAEDMARWLDFLVHQGQTSRGRVVLGASQFARLIEPFTRIPKPGSEYFYGLGWQVDQTYGKKVVWHTGHINHSSSLISFIPSQRVGVAILSNIGPADGVSSYFVFELGFHLYRYLGLIGANERYGPHDRGAMFY